MPASARRSRRSVAAALAAATVALAGCSDDNPQAPDDPEDVADIRGTDDLEDPFDGAYDAKFAEDLPAYRGQEVTLRGDVGQVVSPSTFTLTAAEGEDVEPLLVVIEQPVDGLVAGTTVVVAATPTDDFDPAEAESEFGLDLEDGAYEEWTGDIYLAATAVEPSPSG